MMIVLGRWDLELRDMGYIYARLRTDVIMKGSLGLGELKLELLKLLVGSSRMRCMTFASHTVLYLLRQFGR